jgi:nitroreductase
MRHTLKENPPLAKAMYLSTIIRAWNAGADIICRRAPHLIITHAPEQDPVAPLNSAIALTYLELAAPAFGLGACWAGYFDIAAKLWPPIKQSLGLLEGHVTCSTMMVGYPKYKYHRLPLRNEARITWH